MNTLSILVEDNTATTQPQSGTLSVTRGSRKDGNNVEDIETTRLQQSMRELTEQIATILQDIKEVGDFKLKQVQLQASIKAEGGFVLIGKAGVQGGISLTFTRD